MAIMATTVKMILTTMTTKIMIAVMKHNYNHSNDNSNYTWNLNQVGAKELLLLQKRSYNMQRVQSVVDRQDEHCVTEVECEKHELAMSASIRHAWKQVYAPALLLLPGFMH